MVRVNKLKGPFSRDKPTWAGIFLKKNNSTSPGNGGCE